MSYTVTIPANFHVSRTVPLSDICKNMMGHSMGGRFIMLESLTLQPTDVSSNTPIEIDYTIDCIGIAVDSGRVMLDNTSIQLPLDQTSCMLATGAGEWSYLTLNAVHPRKPSDSPICTNLIISARFVLNKTGC
jgi:hypothetical protein